LSYTRNRLQMPNRWLFSSDRRSIATCNIYAIGISAIGLCAYYERLTGSCPADGERRFIRRAEAGERLLPPRTTKIDLGVFAEHAGEGRPATQAAATQHSSASKHAYQAAVFIAAVFFLSAFLFLLAARLIHAIAEQRSDQQATQAPATCNSAANQQAYEATVLGGALSLLAFFLVLATPFFDPVTEQMGEEQSAEAPAARDSAADQQANETAVFVAADLFAFVLVSFVLVGAALIHAIAEQMGQSQATQAATAKHPFAGRQASEAALLIAAAFFFGVIFVALFFAASLLHSVMEQVRQHQATQAATAQASADQQTSEPTLLVAAFAAFLITAGLLEQLIENRAVFWHRENTPSCVSYVARVRETIFPRTSVNG